MNSPEVQALVEKARESLEVAQGLVRDEHFDFAASRAYYAMFYVAVALLYHRGKTYHKHSAVISGLGREYAKPGRLDAKFHRFLPNTTIIALRARSGWTRIGEISRQAKLRLGDSHTIFIPPRRVGRATFGFKAKPFGEEIRVYSLDKKGPAVTVTLVTP